MKITTIMCEFSEGFPTLFSHATFAIFHRLPPLAYVPLFVTPSHLGMNPDLAIASAATNVFGLVGLILT